MNTRFIATIFLTLALLSFSRIPYSKGKVLGVATAAASSDYTQHHSQLVTVTSFEQKEVIEEEPIAFEIEYKDDPETEYGIETVVEEGVEGATQYKYLVTHWNEEIINKQLVDTTIVEPKRQLVSKGTKIVWKILETPDMGRVWYWRKIRVWATKYDANCIGCTGRTYSGTEVVKGVCATDPRVIKLGTNFYVEGYGHCRAEDIGGAIKGNKVDLGYTDVTKGEWRTGYTNVYLISNAPDGSSKY